MPLKKRVHWTDDHPSIDTKVACIENRKYVEGKIIEYRVDKKKYKIRWEDNKKQVYNEANKEKAIDIMRRMKKGWVVEGLYIGRRVSALFNEKLFEGKITMYIAESEPGAKDQLYHVLWEDNDEEDYDEYEFQYASDLFDSNAVIHFCSSPDSF
jgi:hypothetical protein